MLMMEPDSCELVASPAKYLCVSSFLNELCDSPLDAVTTDYTNRMPYKGLILWVINSYSSSLHKS